MAKAGDEKRKIWKNPPKLLNQLSSLAEENQMKLNKDKTKVMLFNSAKQMTIMPEIAVEILRLWKNLIYWG